MAVSNITLDLRAWIRVLLDAVGLNPEKFDVIRENIDHQEVFLSSEASGKILRSQGVHAWLPFMKR